MPYLEALPCRMCSTPVPGLLSWRQPHSLPLSDKLPSPFVQSPHRLAQGAVYPGFLLHQANQLQQQKQQPQEPQQQPKRQPQPKQQPQQQQLGKAHKQQATAGLAARPAAPEWLKLQGSYVVDTRVVKGTYHNYKQPCSRPNPSESLGPVILPSNLRSKM